MIGMHESSTPPSVRVRPATPADVPVILRFIRELAEYEREPQAVVATEELLWQHLFGSGLAPARPAGPTAECLIGEINGTPQGLAVFFHNFSTWKGRPGVYLEDLYVSPDSRGAGLGKALLSAVAAVAQARGCPRLDWAVLDWNAPAIEFYKALGAKPMNEWTIYRVQGAGIERLAGGV